jgi:hypothetical protein
MAVAAPLPQLLRLRRLREDSRAQLSCLQWAWSWPASAVLPRHLRRCVTATVFSRLHRVLACGGTTPLLRVC